MICVRGSELHERGGVCCRVVLFPAIDATAVLANGSLFVVHDVGEGTLVAFVIMIDGIFIGAMITFPMGYLAKCVVLNTIETRLLTGQRWLGTRKVRSGEKVRTLSFGK